MRDFLKNYKSSIILLACTIIGVIVGLVLGPKASILKPFGDLFINALLMIVVPLVFLSVSSGVASIKNMERFGKIMKSTAIVFMGTTLVIAFLGITSALLFNPSKGLDVSSVKSLMVAQDAETLESKGTLLDQVVSSITVKNFGDLFSSSNLLQLVIFAVLVGTAIAMMGDRGNTIRKFLSEGTEAILKVVSIVMLYAPIGLGCYTATIIGELGSKIIQGYVRVFVIYSLTAAMYFLLFYSLYAFLSAGKQGFRQFWRNAIKPIATALATSSSSACIPSNLEASKNIGVPDDISETVIPLGINIHKDGSVLAVIIKVAFLSGILGSGMANPATIGQLFITVFVVGVFMAPVAGGWLIGEMLVVSIFGFPVEAIPLLTVITTITDIPNTILNTTGNTVSSMLVSRLVEGKDWLIDKTAITTKKIS